MRVLLVSANTITEPYPVYPLGLDYVAGALRGMHTVKIIDLNALEDDRELAAAVLRADPDIIGVSLRNIDNTDSSDPRGFVTLYQETVKTIRSVSSAPIVLGGAGLTLFPAELMTALDADYGVLGEGERLALLLDALERGLSTDGLPGILTRARPEVSMEPWPGRFSRPVAGDSPHLPYYLANGGMLNLQTKRGCPFNCIYCTYPHIEGRRLRLVPPDEVAETAVRLQTAGARYLFVADAAFNSDNQHSMAVARAFIDAGLRIPWGAFLAPYRIPAGFFELMAAAGMTHVEFGTESLSNAVLQSYGKPFTRDDVIRAHEQALAADLFVAHYLLLGGPGETPETVATTLSNVDKLARTVLFFFCGMRIYPHTALYDLAVSEGQLSPTDSILEPIFYHNRLISHHEITRQVTTLAANRSNWVVGSGGAETARILTKLYARGYSGPLWEYLIM